MTIDLREGRTPALRITDQHLGTNDLLQYFMAADRDNERVVQYNDPTHPAFLWLLGHVIDQARQAGREADVAVCGEKCSFLDVTCYVPDCGGPGHIDFRIY